MILLPEMRDLPNFAATPLANVSTALVAALIVDVLIAVAIVRDWRVRGRPHVAYVVGLASMIAVQTGRIAFARSDLWYAITDVLVALAA
jgi:hypothetical protein